MARDKKVNVKINVDDKAAKKKLGGFGRALLSIRSIIGAGIGLAVLNKGLRETVGRAQSAESGLKRLGVAMQSAGRFSEENLQSFERLSVQLEKTTGFQEEQVLQALAVLQTFGQMTRTDMEKTIVATLDMATVFNEDLTQAAIRLGKAYNGQLIGLQRMGVGISKATFNAEGFGAVLNQLGKEQGGQAVARLKGFEGATLRVGVAFGEVGKEAGKFITKNKTIRTVLDSVSGGMTIIANKLRKFRTAEEVTTGRVKELTDALKEQKEEMESVGQVIEDNHLVQLKLEQIEIQKTIQQLNRMSIASKARGDTIFLQNEVQSQLNTAKKDLAKVEKELLFLEQDATVQGSKANAVAREKLRLSQEQAAADRAELKGRKAIQTIAKAWLKGLAERGDKEIELSALLKEIREKERADAFAAQTFFSELAKNLTELEEDAAETTTKAWLDGLRKRADGALKFSAFKKARTDKDLDLVVAAAREELAALERLQTERTSRIAAANREILTGDQANQSERSQVFEALEADVDSFDAKLAEAGKDPVKLERFKQTMDAVAEAIKGVTDREADDLREQLNEIGLAFDSAVQSAGKMTSKELLDIAALRIGVVADMTELGALAAKTFQVSFEATQRNFKLNFDNVDFTQGFNNL